MPFQTLRFLLSIAGVPHATIRNRKGTHPIRYERKGGPCDWTFYGLD